MSNYSSCMVILTQLIGFKKSDNGEKLTLPDEVEIDTLVELKNFLEMKMVENNESLWPCNYCTYNNPIELNSCQMCALPRNVCANQHEYSTLIKNNSPMFCLCNVYKKTKLLNNIGRAVRETKNVKEEKLHKLICECARYGLVKEFQLAMNDPRLSINIIKMSK